ncbi:MAG: DUF4349 domain-containing protein [Deltaproteobacteria bacterium]|nr:DUF4349 domain-containing protein [Deltaproteobacteria bacterium]
MFSRRHLAALVLLTASACAKASAPMVMDGAAAPTATTGEKAGEATKPADGKPGLTAEAPAQAGRKVIRNGELAVRVEDYPKAAAALQAVVDASGGFVQDMQVDHSVEAVSSATWIIRLPAAGLDKALDRLRHLGRVTQEHIGAEDVTEAYTDLQARLDNAIAAEARLRQILAKPEHELKDVLEVERELTRARENVEVLQGRKRLLDSRIDLATLKVTLSVSGKYVPPVDPTLLDRVEEAWWNSLEALSETAQGLLVVVVAVAPWLAILALLGWVAGIAVRWLVQRLGRRGQVRAKPTPPPPPQ